MFDIEFLEPTPIGQNVQTVSSMPLFGSWDVPVQPLQQQRFSRRSSLELLSHVSQDFEPIQLASAISKQLDEKVSCSSRRLSLTHIGDWGLMDSSRRGSLAPLSTLEPFMRELRTQHRRDSFDLCVSNMESLKALPTPTQSLIALATPVTPEVSDASSVASSGRSRKIATCPSTSVKPHELVNPARQHFQDEQWNDRYQELVAFHAHHGHLNIPQTSEANKMLGQWMKRQRYQYQLRKKGHHSTLTETRLQALQKIGFVWESHSSSWNKNFQALQDFRTNHGHVNVPNAHKSLSAWCKHQRREWRKFVKGQKSRITPDRIAKLEALGFKWDPRGLC